MNIVRALCQKLMRLPFRCCTKYQKRWQIDVVAPHSVRQVEYSGVRHVASVPLQNDGAMSGQIFSRTASAYEIVVGTDADSKSVCIREGYHTWLWHSDPALSRYRLVKRIVYFGPGNPEGNDIQPDDSREGRVTVADAIYWLVWVSAGSRCAF